MSIPGDKNTVLTLTVIITLIVLLALLVTSGLLAFWLDPDSEEDKQPAEPGVYSLRISSSLFI